MTASASVPGILRPGTHSARPAASAVGAGTAYFCSTHKLIYQSDGSSWTTIFDPGGLGGGGQTFNFQCIIGDGVNVVGTSNFAYLHFPFAATITGIVGLADASGSATIEVRKCTYTAFDPTTHPATGDKISASAPLTISSAKKAKDTTLTGWTTAISADDVIMFVPTGAGTTIKQVTVSLQFTR
jgi:hypothetical protein